MRVEAQGQVQGLTCALPVPVRKIFEHPVGDLRLWQGGIHGERGTHVVTRSGKMRGGCLEVVTERNVGCSQASVSLCKFWIAVRGALEFLDGLVPGRLGIFFVEL